MPIPTERDRYLCLARRCRNRALGALTATTRRTYQRLAIVYEDMAYATPDDAPA